jgi:predicted nucleotidyltransferase
MKHILKQPDKTTFADYEDRNQVINILCQWAESHPEVSKLLVYGSRARGEQGPDSDLDIAIELRQNTDENACAIWMYEKDNWRRELAPLFPWRAHLEWHDLEGATPVVRGKIEKGHLVVFVREF